MNWGDGPVMIAKPSSKINQPFPRRRGAARTSVLLLQQLRKPESRQNLEKKESECSNAITTDIRPSLRDSHLLPIYC
jgi:hypothetical protein